MKNEIDNEMDKRNMNFLWIVGSSFYNPPFVYMNGRYTLFKAAIIKQKGKKPWLVYTDMDRDEARKSGLNLVNIKKLKLHNIIKKYPEPFRRNVEILKQYIKFFNMKGRIGIYGNSEVKNFFFLWTKLVQEVPDIELVNDFGNDLIAGVRETKDETEAARIKNVGRRSQKVMSNVFDYLSSLSAVNGHAVTKWGEPVTIGAVKKVIALEMTRQDLLEESGVIFSQGSEAGIPHHQGDSDSRLKTGSSIVFDFFTRDKESGYCFDMTRTVFLNEAEPRLLEAYETVRKVQEAVISSLKTGRPLNYFDNLACDIFESANHVTYRQEPSATQGYCHSLGHGLGLEIHESPAISIHVANRKKLQKGHLFTVEPGLYYPDKGWGIRLEDVLWIDQNGQPENFTEYPKEPVIKLKNR